MKNDNLKKLISEGDKKMIYMGAWDYAQNEWKSYVWFESRKFVDFIQLYK